jgi:hypothetical protein
LQDVVADEQANHESKPRIHSQVFMPVAEKNTTENNFDERYQF